MKVVIIGMGEVGRYVAEQLVKERHEVVVVDLDQRMIDRTKEHLDVATLLGYGASPRVLRQARVHEADLVVATTDVDEVNLIAALASKRLGAGKTIARVQSRVYEDGDYEDGADADADDGVHYGMLGIDLVVNPQVLMAEEMFQIARSHGALDVHFFANSRIELAEIQLPADSVVLNIQLKDLRMPEHTRVGAIIREDKLHIPTGGDHMEAGDRVYLFGKTGQMHAAEDMFCHGREAARVAIYSNDVTGERLAKHLSQSGVDTLLMVDDPNTAREMSLRLPRVTVVEGDGTDMTKLEEEEIGRYDIYFATTDDDEDNLMSGLLAKRLGTPRTACKVHRHAYLDIYRQLGIDVALSPCQIAADHILRFARPAQVETVVHLGDGTAEVLEVVAALGSPITKAPLRKVNVPNGVFLGGVITTEDDVLVPDGDHQVQPGDSVIVLALASKRNAVEKLFRRSLF
jgi:trk system potassium uptake protein TrkA